MRMNEEVVLTNLEKISNDFIANESVTLTSSYSDVEQAIAPTINDLAEVIAAMCGNPELVEEFKTVGERALFDVTMTTGLLSEVGPSMTSKRATICKIVRKAMLQYANDLTNQEFALEVSTELHKLCDDFVTKNKVTLRDSNGEIYKAIEPTIDNMVKVFTWAYDIPELAESLKFIGSYALEQRLLGHADSIRHAKYGVIERAIWCNTVQCAMYKFCECNRTKAYGVLERKEYYDNVCLILNGNYYLNTLFNILSDKAFEALCRRYICGESSEEICKAMNVTVDEYAFYKRHIDAECQEHGVDSRLANILTRSL